MIKLPEAILVGAVSYATRWSHSKAKHGKVDNVNSVISIRSDQGIDQMRDTLLHEVLHALFHTAGGSDVSGLDYDTEERLVRLLTPWLLIVLRDNPDLLRALLLPDGA